MKPTQFKNSQSGFTLIELVVVIVILGILAATALPKFADLQSDARLASVNAAKGSVAAASDMAHGIFLARATTSGSSVTYEGGTATNANGYPKASEVKDLAGLGTEYTATVTGTAVEIGLTAKGACSFTYTESTAVGSKPAITSPTLASCQ